jgi:uncharacterized delta-60 repeat protein
VASTNYHDHGRRAAFKWNNNFMVDVRTGTYGDPVVTQYIDMGGTDYANCLLVTAADKILVAGCTGVYPNQDMAVLRLNADFSADNTFDTDGKLTIDLGSNVDVVHDIALQKDGKIVLAGMAFDNIGRREAVVIRLLDDGSLDAGFGTGGMVKTYISDNGIADNVDIDLDSSGNIFLASLLSGDPAFGVTKITSTGLLDPGFGTQGIFILPFGAFRSGIGDLKIQQDGKLIITGSEGTPNGYDIFVCRINGKGTLDSAFGTNGKVVYPSGTSSGASSAWIQKDGKVLAAGFIYKGNLKNFGIVRFTSSGTVDPTFGTAGATVIELGKGDASVNAMFLQDNGKIILSGNCYVSTSEQGDIYARLLNDEMVTSINQSGMPPEVVVYPSPSRGEIFFKGPPSINYIELVDMQGKREIYQEMPVKTTLRGTLMVNIYSDKTRITRLIVVE